MNKVIQETGGHKLTNDDSVFLTAGLQEAIAHLALTLGLSDTDKSVLHGVTITKSGDDYTHTAGAIYYMGEVFTVDALSSALTDSGTPRFAIETTFPSNNPIQYENGDSKNVHHIRKMKLVVSNHPDGLFDYNDVGDSFYQFFSGAGVYDAITTVAGATANVYVSDTMFGGVRAIKHKNKVTMFGYLQILNTNGNFQSGSGIPNGFVKLTLKTALKGAPASVISVLNHPPYCCGTASVSNQSIGSGFSFSESMCHAIPAIDEQGNLVVSNIPPPGNTRKLVVSFRVEYPTK